MSTITPLDSPAPEAFSDVMQRLSKERERLLNEDKTVSVVILGAGPAGLMQAIVALANGNEVTVLEKRPEIERGRIHVVTIDPKAKKVMEDYGIYQCLAEKGVLGPPSSDRFAFSVSIREIQEAMKKVIEGIVPGMSVISYETRLDQVDHDSKDLIIKTNTCAKRIIKAPNYLIVAEGTHSDTLTHMLGGRRIEVLPPLIAIGGIFKDRQELNKSFLSINRINPIAAGLILSIPGYIYAARFPTEEEKSALHALTSEGERCDYIKERLLSDFYMPSEKQEKVMEPFKPYQFPEDSVLIDQTSVRSSISDVFCGILSAKTHFFVTGDSRLELDIFLGSGCNNAILSATPLISLFQKNLAPVEILEQYVKNSKNLLIERLAKARCFRMSNKLPYNDDQFDKAMDLFDDESFISDCSELN